MRVKVQRGLDSGVPQLLLRNLGGYADIVQDRSVYVAKLMPRYALKRVSKASSNRTSTCRFAATFLRNARYKYARKSRIGGRSASCFTRTASETVAAASSKRFMATQGSASNFSAYETACGAISCAAVKTHDAMTLPRGSTAFTRC